MDQPSLFSGNIKLDRAVKTPRWFKKLCESHDDVCASRHKGAATSMGANKLVNKDRDRQDVLGWIKSAGDEGMTLDEVCIKMNRKPNELSGRFTELKVREEILRTTRRRPTRTGATAYVHVAL